MEQNNESGALNTASELELAVTCGFIGSTAQYQTLLLSAVSQLRALHARVEELEAMLDAVGAGGVSAQRVTQSQPLKASSDWLMDGGLLYRLNDRGTNCDEINVTMAGGLRTEAARVERAGEILNMLKAVQQAEDHIEQPIEMVAAPAELNLDDYYCKGCGRIGEIEELSAQDKAKLRKLDGKPKTAAAPVVLVEALHARRALLAGVSAPAALAVERGEVLVTVSGFTGSGKSAIAGEIETMCRALGLQVEWPDSDSEKHMTHADWIAALEQYKPRVRIVECNVPHSVVKGQDK